MKNFVRTSMENTILFQYFSSFFFFSYLFSLRNVFYNYRRRIVVRGCLACTSTWLCVRRKCHGRAGFLNARSNRCWRQRLESTATGAHHAVSGGVFWDGAGCATVLTIGPSCTLQCAIIINLFNMNSWII